ncbi:hypothetical protein HYH03_010132 [Edaphochlamys debaryana]|uniref:Glycosyl transferase CAP10 domain-containing protein n=1 Tax=Edaphochlamys debaryana TaxID=47281 RepID=A0A835XXD9_9CHLO|nr:hypothetical protein HYH03_010132 [Edaphochlamys debaryana]|eukprot:KAG2491564.1 hypothetical protein HYH03_010132 [Edaphochlamys debaryana]
MAARAGPPPRGVRSLAAFRETYPGHNWAQQVQTLTEPDQLDPHVPEDDLSKLYEENLDIDLSLWRNRVERAGRPLDTGVLMEWAREVATVKGTIKLIMIKDGRLSFPLEGQTKDHLCPGHCDVVLLQLVKDLMEWMAEDPSGWPDVLFVANSADGGVCRHQSFEAWANGTRSKQGSGHFSCPVPVLSVIKEWGQAKDEDILVPLTPGKEGWALHSFPWEDKVDRAVWRGSHWCHSRHYAFANETCTRTYFALQMQESEEWRQYVDVGVLADEVVVDKRPRSIKRAEYMPITEAARFRYTLALDGITASNRLAKLLGLNSVVLKQASPWIEWYYRSLLPNIHYVPFWEHSRDDVLYVIDTLREQPEKNLKAMVTRTQELAYRFLRPEARRAYWKRALVDYRKLFGDDMDDIIRKQPNPRPR